MTQVTEKMQLLFDQARKAFKKTYRAEPIFIAFAPGRVNLIGEHVDYNAGFVLPIAIEEGVVCAVAPRKDKKVRAVSLQVGEPTQFPLSDREKYKRWDDALRGIIEQINELNYDLPGMNILITGNIPMEAGLSSSAAFMVSAVMAMLAVAGVRLDPVDVARLSQRVENKFMDVNCGILDQMASAAGKQGYALMLDCRDLTYRYVPLNGDFEVVVCHTGVTRSLATTKYNERRYECARSIQIFQDSYGTVFTMRDVGDLMLDMESWRLGDDKTKRVRHVMTEIQRAKDAVTALEAQDVVSFGKLITSSHESLRDDYEVSCKELDTMVELALSQPECYGARLVGAGFGGCAIALVKPNNTVDFIDKMSRLYQDATGIAGTFLHVHSGPGATVLEN